MVTAQNVYHEINNITEKLIKIGLVDDQKCHLTLGQFKNCRIPVCSPIMPNVFISFILRSFYNTALRKFTDELNLKNSLFPTTITTKEQKLLHISIT